MFIVSNIFGYFFPYLHFIFIRMDGGQMYCSFAYKTRGTHTYIRLTAREDTKLKTVLVPQVSCNQKLHLHFNMASSHNKQTILLYLKLKEAFPAIFILAVSQIKTI
jgi:hypothetical protein